MLPTLNFTGDVLLVEKLSPRLGKVGRGDVVLTRSPENPRKIITKRIMGMEGDTVTYLVDPGRSERSRSLVVRNLMGPRLNGNFKLCSEHLCLCLFMAHELLLCAWYVHCCWILLFMAVSLVNYNFVLSLSPGLIFDRFDERS